MTNSTLIKITVYTCIAILIIMFGVPAGAETMNVYPMTTVVTSLDYENDLVICTDYNGNDWTFTGIEDWDINDIATMLMDTNGTEIIYDDIIIMVRYNGYWG